MNNAQKERKIIEHLLKKIGDDKGTFHAKMGTIKDRNGKDLTEAKKKKKKLKRSGENTQISDTKRS